MTSETSRTQQDVTVDFPRLSWNRHRRFLTSFFLGYHGDLRVQIFLDHAWRGRPTHFLRGATLHPPLTVVQSATISSAQAAPFTVLHDGCGSGQPYQGVCPASIVRSLVYLGGSRRSGGSGRTICTQVAVQSTFEDAYLPCDFETVFKTPRLPFLGAVEREFSFLVQVTGPDVGEGQGVRRANCNFTGELGEVFHVHGDQSTRERVRLSVFPDAAGANLIFSASNSCS